MFSPVDALSEPISRSTYFAITSTSRFTGSDGAGQCGQLAGGRDQRHLKPVGRPSPETVSEMPSTVIDPFRRRSGPVRRAARSGPPPSARGCAGQDLSGAVDMTLDDVTAEPTVHRGGALEVDRAACGQPTQAGPAQCLAHHVGGELAAGQHFDHRQAHAVDGDRVAMTGVGSHHRTRMVKRAESPRSSLPTTSPNSSTIPVNTAPG